MIAQPETYTKKQAVSALFLFLIVFFLAFSQGLFVMSDLPISLIRSSNYLFPILDIAALIIFLGVFKEKAESIGIHLKNLKQSMLWGFLFLGVQLIFYASISYLFNDVSKVMLGSINLPMVILFFNSALAEEMIYRGYIETRLQGLVQNRHLCSIITAILFVLIHYPLKWMSGQQLNALSFPHILLLLSLHVTCSLTYKKSNCLWGAVCLHLLYNLGNSLIIFI